ncbi:unnamed protein product [Staurois parvus]|uniref:Uncharacterized protein n=1 Tax=Staurois parvus TaxID=386267 RepID=A0ABN9B151_9NEOB|nr:unnamed protein product [Staurois parvus]
MYTDHQGTDDQCALMIHLCIHPSCQCSSVPTCQCPSVPPISVHQCRLSVPCQCCLSVPSISAA